MRHKTASKTKGKTSPVKLATLGKKMGPPKTFEHGKGWNKANPLLGLKPKILAGGGKPKVNYGTHTPVVGQIHDGGKEAVLARRPTARVEQGTLSAEEEHETELAEKLISHVADTGSDVNELCETYGLRREELGRLTGFSLRALAGWAAGELPSHPAKRRLQEVRRLLDALAEIVKRDSIPKWLHQPNSAFDRLTPLQVIELGEIDRLWAMVHDLGAGHPE
jgi:hypothetical protein